MATKSEIEEFKKVQAVVEQELDAQLEDAIQASFKAVDRILASRDSDTIGLFEEPKWWKDEDEKPNSALVHEATTTVDQHTRHSETGKAYVVQQHEREIDSSETREYPEIEFVGESGNVDRIKRLLDKHPQEVVKRIKEIKIVFPEKLKELWEYSGGTNVEGQNFDGFAVKDAVVLLHGFDDYTLHHEIGHVAHMNSKVFKAWHYPYRKDLTFDRDTEHSKTNASEGFADAYAAFIASDGVAKNPKTQRTFDVVKKVLNGIPKVRKD